MASMGNWSVIFEDKTVQKQTGDGAGICYKIDDDTFWGQSKWSNIWAIQYGTSVSSDEVEYRDETAHTSFANATPDLGDFQDFIDKWDAVHLSVLQAEWDADNVDGETDAEKITRLGARPTSYSS